MAPIALGDTDTALGVLAAMAALTYTLSGLVRSAVRQRRADVARARARAAGPPAVARHVARYRP